MKLSIYLMCLKSGDVFYSVTCLMLVLSVVLDFFFSPFQAIYVPKEETDSSAKMCQSISLVQAGIGLPKS